MSDSEKAGEDPESLQPLPRGLSLYRKWTRQTYRSSSASISSVASHWSIRWVAEWSSASHRASRPQNRIVTPLSESQKNFLIAILGELPQNEIIVAACAWYIGFLEFKIGESWTTLIHGFVRRVNCPTPYKEGLSIVFEVLRVIVMELSHESIALTDLVDKLYRKNLLNIDDEERSHAKQLVFIVFGWISALYPPRFDPEPMKLQIINPSERGPAIAKKSMKRNSPRRRPKALETYEQSLESNDYLDQPFHTLLGRFGRIIPQQNRQSFMGGHPTPSISLPTRHDEQWLESSLLCFHTLDKIASIRVEWVDSLSQHLEFDRCTKRLKLFRRPSLCLVMSIGENPLSQMFWEADDNNSLMRSPEVMEDASQFYIEVLLSYRLLFGQDSKSQRDFSKPRSSLTPLPEEHFDSLLPILCSQDCDSPSARPIYEMIEAEDAKTQYCPVVDFPFLGKQLLDVQRFVRGYKPNGLRTLWYDKRDYRAWCTFWAVIIIGGITAVLTTILGLLQFAVGIRQVK